MALPGEEVVGKVDGDHLLAQQLNVLQVTVSSKPLSGDYLTFTGISASCIMDRSNSSSSSLSFRELLPAILRVVSVVSETKYCKLSEDLHRS